MARNEDAELMDCFRLVVGCFPFNPHLDFSSYLSFHFYILLKQIIQQYSNAELINKNLCLVLLCFCFLRFDSSFFFRAAVADMHMFNLENVYFPIVRFYNYTVICKESESRAVT